MTTSIRSIPGFSAGIDQSVGKRTADIRKNFEQLSSGKRINSSADDPAGLAVAVRMLANADLGSVATRNISDAVSVAGIAEAGISSAAEITGRLGELAARASNGTLSAENRQALDQEFQALRSELDRIANATTFGGRQLLSGEEQFAIQVGTDGSAKSNINITLPGVKADTLKLPASITTEEDARGALDATSAATATLASAGAEIGSAVSRLSTALENSLSSQVNERTAAAQILDADIAQQSALLTANRIGQQAGVAVQTQANLQPQLALKLLS